MTAHLRRAAPATLAVLLCAVAMTACRGSSSRLELIDRFDEAQKSPEPGAFSVIDAELARERHRAIAVTPVAGSRLSWRLTVPRGAWLWVSIGMQTASWTAEGDGVKFAAAVADGASITTLFEQHLHPFASTGDRKWFPIRVSLAQYAGREVEIVLMTTASADGRGADQRNDLPLWGVPEIVVR